MIKINFFENNIKDYKDSININSLFFGGLNQSEFIKNNLKITSEPKLYNEHKDFIIDVLSQNKETEIFWDLKLYPLDFNFILKYKKILNYLLFDIVFIEEKYKSIKDFEEIINKGISFIILKCKESDLASKKIIIYSRSLVSIDSSDNLEFLRNSKPTSRSFNQFELSNNWYTKTSLKRSKLQNEFDYIKNLPVSLKDFFPVIDEKSFKITEKSASYRLKKINGSDLASISIANKISDEIADAFINFIFSWFDAVREKKIKMASSSMSEFLVHKIQKRAYTIKEDSFISDIKIFSNYFNLIDFKDHCARLISLLEKNKLYIDQFSPGLFHGDLCLSNIICDDNLQFFLVDPRGLENKKASVNIIYEVAKLRHSIISQYDYINMNRSSLISDKNGNLLIEYNKNKSLDKLKNIYSKITKKLNLDNEIIKIVESSLFLTMIPLHLESRSKCLKFYVKSLNIFKSINLVN